MQGGGRERRHPHEGRQQLARPRGAAPGAAAVQRGSAQANRSRSTLSSFSQRRGAPSGNPTREHEQIAFQAMVKARSHICSV